MPPYPDSNGDTGNAHAGRARRRSFIRGTFRTAVVVAALLALGLAACGDDDEATGTGSDEPTDEPLVIGNVGNASGPHGVYQQAVQAWAEVVNENGGIAGRPVRVEVADDADDPVTHLNLVEQMVEEESVVAFVGMPADNTMAASAGYLETMGVPVVGGALGNPAWGTSPILFPQGFVERERARVITQAAAISGRTRYTFIWPGAEFPPAPARQGIYEALRAAGEEVGIELVTLDEQFQAGAPDDYTAVCLAAQGAGIELMTLAADNNTQAQVIESCACQGFDPIYVTTGTTTTPELLDLAGENMEGAVGPSRTPWTADEPADVEVYREAMAANDLEIGPNSMDGWVSGRIFEEALRRIDGEVTPPAVAEALRGLDGEDLDGLVTPIDFGSSPTEPNPGSSCFWPLVVKDGVWAPAEAGQLCLP